LIRSGRVKVNGLTAKIGDKVDPDIDVVEFDGSILKPVKKEYFVINKPKGFITTIFDPQGRFTIVDILRRRDLFHVGRLDKDTRGLLIVTNDGDLANRLLHPRYKIERKYRVTVKGEIDDSKIKRLLKGIELEDHLARFDSIEVVEISRDRSILEVSLHEGRKRMIRKMFDKIGNPVLDLIRIQFGPIKLGNLKEGEVRPLTEEEIERLRCLL